MRRTYPISLVIEGRPCLVVGGGRVAERKIAALLEAGAQVRVVAPEITEQIKALADSDAIALQLREPRAEDLNSADLVILATDDRDLNARLSEACRERGLLVNVVDQPELCSFYVPAVISRGPISIAISTGGASPALAAHIRQKLEEAIGQEYGELARLMGELRKEVIAALPTHQARAAAWQRVLESEVMDLLSQGRTNEARKLLRRTLGLSG